jgi:predicted glycosyltransferase involved in capsule biosynthesis
MSESTYSIIIPFRDRHEHLEKLLPVFSAMPFAEIIVVEQDDNNKFRKSCLLNIGTRYASGDVFVFQDVDYVLDKYSSSPSYGYFEKDQPEYSTMAVLPVEQAIFVDMDMQPLPIEEVPSGYRHFKDKVDDDFFGGVVMMSKKLFESINGFNPNFEGWGLEDADIRKRLSIHGCGYFRMPGKFYVLPHKDNNPGAGDDSFAENVRLYQDTSNVSVGNSNLTADVKVTTDILDIKWIKATNFKVK